jgi:dTDP-4-amino-4,6-dideoxygalactose transaminase
MLVTNDRNVAKRVEKLRNYGQEEKYHHATRGYNRRLDTLQAAVLRVKLKYLAQWNTARRQHAELYRGLLEASGVATPREAEYAESVWHLYVIRVEQRDAFKAHLASRGIATGIHYPIPIHLQPAYKDLGYERGDFPVTEAHAQGILSLPMYAELTREQIEFVALTIHDFLSANPVRQPASEPLLSRPAQTA